MEENAKKPIVEKTFYLLENQQVFSQSILWALQQSYYHVKGVEAWRRDEVPHYVTSNPTVANSYAEIVLAFRRDQGRRMAHCDEPLYLCELGGGSGRFAFHFLSRLTKLCELEGVPASSFRYVLTDFTQSNLDFWREHPCFQPFFESGMLDIALFDINQSEHLALQLRGETIAQGSLQRPLVVIANYVFDGVAQDLYYFDAERSFRCLVSLIVDEDPATLSPADLLGRMQYRYDCEAITEPPYQETYLQELLAEYQRTLTDTHLLFPVVGLRCLQRLKSLSKDGLLLLTADKGDHRLSSLYDKPPPSLIHHGSFSLSVNYHAYKTFCEQSGGLALFPDLRHHHLNMGCLLMVAEANDYPETARAYRRHVQDFSPDDFYIIAQHAQQYIEAMSVEDILAYLRLGHYDSQQFACYLPRLLELAPTLNEAERLALSDAIDKILDAYFPLDREEDLAYQAACLLYEMNDYTRALTYFERSIELSGEYTGTLFNMAACYQAAGQSEPAQTLLRKVLEYDPHNQQARELLAGEVG